jgi:hypothetical protein
MWAFTLPRTVAHIMTYPAGAFALFWHCSDPCGVCCAVLCCAVLCCAGRAAAGTDRTTTRMPTMLRTTCCLCRTHS